MRKPSSQHWVHSLLYIRASVTPASTSQDRAIRRAKAERSVSGELIKENPQVCVLMRQVCVGFGHSVSLSLLVFQCSVLQTKLKQILMAHAAGRPVMATECCSQNSLFGVSSTFHSDHTPKGQIAHCAS